jgi:hypothetical protein
LWRDITGNLERELSSSASSHFGQDLRPGLATKTCGQDLRPRFTTMPRLTFNRKDRAGQSIGIEAAMTGDFTSRFNQ